MSGNIFHIQLQALHPMTAHLSRRPIWQASRFWLAVMASAAFLSTGTALHAAGGSRKLGYYGKDRDKDKDKDGDDESDSRDKGEGEYDPDYQRWVDEVTKRLPPGVTIETADKETLIAAIQAVIIANPTYAPKIAGALAKAISLEKGVIVAEAVGRLFRTHPGIAAQAGEIGKSMALAMDSKGAGERARAIQIGYVASTLIYYLNPKEPTNQQLITDLINNVLNATPKLEYSRAVFGTIVSTLRALGVPGDLIALIENNVLDAMTNSMIRNQLRTELWNVYQGPDYFFPGVIVVQETPVVNS